MRYLVLSFIGTLVLCGVALAAPIKATDASGTVVFKIRTGHANQGTEEYKISDADSRHVLTSTIRLRKLGEQILSVQEETLASNWSPLHYSLKTTMGREQRESEVNCLAGGVRMRTEYEGKIKDKSVGLSSPALVMDNVVPSHFQVLIKEYNALHAQQPLTFQLLVPQLPAEFTGVMSRAGSETGTLESRRVTLQKYVLSTRGLSLQIWADDHDQLMRVYLPEQDTEFVRVGFHLD